MHFARVRLLFFLAERLFLATSAIHEIRSFRNNLSKSRIKTYGLILSIRSFIFVLERISHFAPWNTSPIRTEAGSGATAARVI